ncbi:MAG TPA: hypothetical protein VG476_02475 [Acidimicrobiales bacterium]|nr:hypothetical protein [Acidimicrobiales bacterium]
MRVAHASNARDWQAGDEMYCNGEVVLIRAVIVRLPSTHSWSPIRDDWYAVEAITDVGTQWGGYPPERCPIVVDADLIRLRARLGEQFETLLDIVWQQERAWYL